MAGELAGERRLQRGYVLEAEVSQGGMGAIYRARDPSGRVVAAKRLLAAENAARFEIEARLLARLRHPRVVQVLDSVEDPSGRYLIMEWIDGIDLARLLARDGTPGLPEEDVVGYALEACEALAYVHEQQTVHRDVKPHNLMSVPDAGIVLVDFGIARDLLAASGVTRGLGTFGFMAPEALGSGPFTARTDVFGLGATVWTLLTGSVPPLGVREPPAGVSRGVAETLLAALAFDPEHRLPSMQAFAAGLGAALRPGGGRELSLSLPDEPAAAALLEAVVRTAAGVFDAAASSLALSRPDGGLVYRAAWGAGADKIIGVELAPGEGLVGAVIASGTGRLIERVREDPRFASRIAERTGYVPHTMIIVPLVKDRRALGALTLLDRRDGRPYDVGDLDRATLFGDLALAALATDSDPPPHRPATAAQAPATRASPQH